MSISKKEFIIINIVIFTTQNIVKISVFHIFHMKKNNENS